MDKLLPVFFLVAASQLLAQAAPHQADRGAALLDAPTAKQASQIQQSQKQLKALKARPIPIYSFDGVFCVTTRYPERANYRWAIMKSASLEKERLEKALSIKLGSKEFPIQIIIGNETKSDSSILKTAMRLEPTRLLYQLTIPNPDTCDLALYREAIVEALLRNHSESIGNEPGSFSVPKWAIHGFLRYLDPTTHRADYDEVWFIHDAKRLPLLSQLLSSPNSLLSSNPACANMVSRFIWETTPAANRAQLFATPWQPTNLADLIAPRSVSAIQDSSIKLETAWLAWFNTRANKITEIGKTSYGAYARWHKCLTILLPGVAQPITPEWIIANLSSKTAQTAAQKIILQLHRKSTAQSIELIEVAQAYTAFYHAVSEGKDPSACRWLYEQAVSLDQALEKRYKESLPKAQFESKTPTTHQ